MAPMTSAVLAFPPRTTPNGTLATVAVDSDDHHAQQIGILAATIRGERQMAPSFGLTDPAFVGLDAGELAAQMQVYGPPVAIVDIVTDYADDGTATVAVTFT